MIQAHLSTAGSWRQCWPVQKTVDTKPVSQVLCKCLYSCHTVGDRRRDKETIEIPQLHCCCSFFWFESHFLHFFRPSCQTPERRPKVVTPWKVLNLRGIHHEIKYIETLRFTSCLNFFWCFDTAIYTYQEKSNINRAWTWHCRCWWKRPHKPKLYVCETDQNTGYNGWRVQKTCKGQSINKSGSAGKGRCCGNRKKYCPFLLT